MLRASSALNLLFLIVNTTFICTVAYKSCKVSGKNYLGLFLSHCLMFCWQICDFCDCELWLLWICHWFGKITEIPTSHCGYAEVLLRARHQANWPAEKLIWSAWFGYLEDSFSWKEVQFKKFCLPQKSSCPPLENVNEAPGYAYSPTFF